jgi:hypothetical protein
MLLPAGVARSGGLRTAAALAPMMQSACHAQHDTQSLTAAARVPTHHEA